MAKCKYCGGEIQWRQQGFKWIAERNGQRHECAKPAAPVLAARRREALDKQATAFLERNGRGSK